MTIEDRRTRRLRELEAKWRRGGYCDYSECADELAAVLDTNGDTKLEARMRCINCADMGATYWPDENFGPICERCNALIRPRADTEGDRPEPEPGLALTLQNDFLAIGRLIQDGRADFERIAEWSHRLIQALSRYFHDDKLIMFDREGLIKFIDNQPPAERHNCVDHPLADHEWICLTCLDAKDEPSEPIADTEGDRQVTLRCPLCPVELSAIPPICATCAAKIAGAVAGGEGDRPEDDTTWPSAADVLGILKSDTEGDQPTPIEPKNIYDCINCSDEAGQHWPNPNVGPFCFYCYHLLFPDPPVQP